MVSTRIYSVTQLNQEIKGLLESNPSFLNLFVQGEISNHKPHPSGHHYMTIKDQDASISAVLFRTDAARLRFRLQNGMKVVARGRVSSFPKSGQVQLYLADMMPDGEGALHLQFEQLKEKLYADGLFDDARKRSLPVYPERIALITSPSGAVVQDMLRILRRRWPMARVDLFPALVQGSAAPDDLVQAIHAVNRHGKSALIILGRGGGSLEDLWAFNEEQVAREIYASGIPVISAVGHEPDVTIADFVADLRAPTPSGAAELATPDAQEVQQTLTMLERRMLAAHRSTHGGQMMRLRVLQERLAAQTPVQYLRGRKIAVESLEGQLRRTMRSRLDESNLAVDYAVRRTTSAIDRILAGKSAQLGRNIASVDALSPLKVLGRGYAVATDENGAVITDAQTLRKGDRFDIRFAQGTAFCAVCEIKKGNHHGRT